ncbi:Protein N-terminal amidase [Madurella mycetomatis]|uniref:Protein N-terminal amidase n=1 Tax=Madurella mycetomatis TaxID=100816 RepID=A0A175VVK9_9PEZI|nr:Protein N-terminal amidase [Madurella mycetomatis]KXX83152.1 Protein N-terminal amidase [Madurella mycetomatis]
MKIGCLQFSPQVGDVSNNLTRADAVLSKADPRELEDLDLLVLPEMAFSGYNFKSVEDILPYLEPTGSGISSLWARTTALKYDCTVAVGYPEQVVTPGLQSPAPEYYNSLIVVNGDGETVANYRKSFLYYTDQTWAREGHGFFKGTIGDFGQVAMGICIPYKFEAPWHAYEFAFHILEARANLVIVSMAWLTNEDRSTFTPFPEDPDFCMLTYWVRRLEPIIRAESDEEIIVVFCNRCGIEDDATYSGTSAVIGIKDGEVSVYGLLGRGVKDLLVVDTEKRPFAKLIDRPEQPVAAGDESSSTQPTEVPDNEPPQSGSHAGSELGGSFPTPSPGSAPSSARAHAESEPTTPRASPSSEVKREPGKPFPVASRETAVRPRPSLSILTGPDAVTPFSTKPPVAMSPNTFNNRSLRTPPMSPSEDAAQHTADRFWDKTPSTAFLSSGLYTPNEPTWSEYEGPTAISFHKISHTPWVEVTRTPIASPIEVKPSVSPLFSRKPDSARSRHASAGLPRARAGSSSLTPVQSASRTMATAKTPHQEDQASEGQTISIVASPSCFKTSFGPGESPVRFQPFPELASRPHYRSTSTSARRAGHNCSHTTAPNGSDTSPTVPLTPPPLLRHRKAYSAPTTPFTSSTSVLDHGNGDGDEDARQSESRQVQLQLQLEQEIMEKLFAGRHEAVLGKTMARGRRRPAGHVRGQELAPRSAVSV